MDLTEVAAISYLIPTLDFVAFKTPKQQQIECFLDKIGSVSLESIFDCLWLSIFVSARFTYVHQH